MAARVTDRWEIGDIVALEEANDWRLARQRGGAVEKLALMAQGIGGGTRIGESLATFNRWHARRVINSRTAVMIVFDGHDTGEPKQLAEEMLRLRSWRQGGDPSGRNDFGRLDRRWLRARRDT
jgi:VWA domain containing CoxE-like protein